MSQREGRSHAIFLVAAFVTLVALSGCFGGITNQEHPYGQRVKERALHSMSSVDTYHMEMDMHLEGDDQSVDLRWTARVNRTAEKARLEMTMRGREIDGYLNSTTAFVEIDGRWRTSEISGQNPWNRRAMLEQQRKVLKSAEITAVSNETLNGTPVTVLTIDPEEKQVKKVLQQRGDAASAAGTVKRVTYRQYVSDKTGRLLRVEAKMTMVIEEQTVNGTVDIRISKFNEQTTITIPREAREAAT